MSGKRERADSWTTLHPSIDQFMQAMDPRCRLGQLPECYRAVRPRPLLLSSCLTIFVATRLSGQTNCRNQGFLKIYTAHRSRARSAYGCRREYTEAHRQEMAERSAPPFRLVHDEVVSSDRVGCSPSDQSALRLRSKLRLLRFPATSETSTWSAYCPPLAVPRTKARFGLPFTRYRQCSAPRSSEKTS